MWNRVVRHITFPLWLRAKGHPNVLPDLREIHARAAEEQALVRERQEKAVADILRHAYETTEFYRGRLKRVVAGGKIGSRALRDLPPLTKDDIRNAGSSMLSRAFQSSDLIAASTGGSTGTPMRFFRDRRCIDKRRAQEIFADQKIGYRIGDRVGLFVASAHFDGRMERFKARVRNASYERLLRFDPAICEEHDLEEFYRKFVRYRPVMLKSFPNALTIFVDFLERRGLRVPSPRAISCTGENVYDWQREKFERVFRCPVYERYATKESGVVAFSRPGVPEMAVFAPGVFLEILRDDGAPCEVGEVGHVVVTDLYNYGMPLIRYEIGDAASWSSEAYGDLGFPHLAAVLGRDRDVVVDSAGRLRPGYLFVEEINKAGISGQFQVVQESQNLLVLKVAGAVESDQELEYLLKRFRAIMGDGASVILERVESIPRDPSGKYRYVRSEIGLNRLGPTARSGT